MVDGGGGWGMLMCVSGSVKTRSSTLVTSLLGVSLTASIHLDSILDGVDCVWDHIEAVAAKGGSRKRCR